MAGILEGVYIFELFTWKEAFKALIHFPLHQNFCYFFALVILDFLKVHGGQKYLNFPPQNFKILL
jgi:hypothetical protein